MIPAVGGAATLPGPGLAVGYQPVIEEIPQGVRMAAAAVVSDDLRVRAARGRAEFHRDHGGL